MLKAFGVITKDSRFTFGKYNRKAVKQILEDDPSYIVWLHENTTHTIDRRLLTEACQIILAAEQIAEVCEDLAKELDDIDFSIEDTF